MAGALALICVFIPGVYAQHVGNQNDPAPTFQWGHGTRTQSIQECEPPTKAPGGSPGRTTGNTTNQSPFQRPTMIPSGTYSVHSQAQTGVGDRVAGSATVQQAGPASLRLQLPKGSATLTYACVGQNGVTYFTYGNQKVGFFKVYNPDPNYPATYDVHWYGNGAPNTHTVETWQYNGR
jgi:hypothetical protein